MYVHVGPIVLLTQQESERLANVLHQYYIIMHDNAWFSRTLAGPSFIELLKSEILLKNFLLTDEQDTSHKLYLCLTLSD